MSGLRRSRSSYESLNLNADQGFHGSFEYTTTHQDIYSYWFFLIRRVLHTYYFVLACFLISLLGLNLVLQLFFALLAPSTKGDTNPIVLLIGLFGLMTFYSYLFAKILSYGAILIKEVWYFQQYYCFRVFSMKPEEPEELGTVWDTTVQIFFIITLDLTPIVTGITGAVVYSSFSSFIMYWLFAACSAAVFHIIFWWLAYWCKELNMKVQTIWKLPKADAVDEGVPLLKGMIDVEDDKYPTFYNDDSNILIKNVMKLKNKKTKAIAYAIVVAIVVAMAIVLFVYKQTYPALLVAVVAIFMLYSIAVIWIEKYVPRTRRLIFAQTSRQSRDIFWWKYWGIDPSLTFHTCSVLFIMFLAIAGAFVIYGKYSSLALVIIGMLSVCCVSLITVFRPHLLWIAVVTVISVFALVCVICNFISLGTPIGFIAIATIIATQFMVNPHHERLPISTFVVFVLLFFLIGGGILVLGSLNQSGQIGNRAVFNETYPVQPNGYPICARTWYNGSLDILDLAFMGNLAYDEDSYVDYDLNAWFGNQTDFQKIYTDNTTVTFYDFYSQRLNLSIISIRGTLGPQDDIQDLDLFLEVLTMQFASLTLPFFELVPSNFTVDVVGVMGILKEKIQIEGRHYYVPVFDYIQSIQGTRSILIVGHSLGGTIGKIVGDQLNIPMVGFSAPGITLSRNKYDVTLQEMNRLNINIVPYRDIIPLIDQEEGLVQNIDCYASVYECHLLMTSTCTLLRTCGDRYLRGISNCPS
eukprot:TRINITY_DN8278_c0_g1_i1.p1 TRINITY_DN8278_c0_g1~~TRINITY_DN8278_c0_g1_i1.p1  ORF type:complete len:750 (-),score=123.73 TRINITY_DN8278_c0_g1_i1:172-2421(-)